MVEADACGSLSRVWRHVDWPRAEWWTGQVDVVHGTNLVVPPTREAGRVVTVHDLVALHFPKMVRRPHRREPGLARKSLQSGTLVHTFSEFVRDEVINHLDADPAQVVAIPPGPPPTNEAAPADGHRLAGTDRYVLALGTVEPRKNVVMLINAFDKVADGDPDLHLVLAGTLGDKVTDVKEAIGNAACRCQIVCLGWVEEPEKAALLRGATVLAYPSKYEGFGLPLLEAMEAGVPVVTSNEGALLEVAGAAAVFVSPDSVNELAGALADLLQDEPRRRALAYAGRENLTRFRWDWFEADLLALYERAAG